MSLYLGSKKVAPTKTITKEVTSMKPFFDAGGRCGYSNAISFNDIIKYNDTSNVENMESMFESCPKLTSIPQLDTSNVRNMTRMFYYCSSLTSIPQLDTSKVFYMERMFANCSSLTSMPQLDTSNVTDMTVMFYDCVSLTSIPQLDTSKVTDMYRMFDNCSSLTSIKMKNMKVSFDISASTEFTREALLEIINNCFDLTTLNKTATLTMGSTNLTKLTDEDKAIATAKGWTLK